MTWTNEEELIQQIKKKILYFASRHISNREAAKDVTQETLLAFLEVLRQGGAAAPGNPGGLAYGIFRNKLANYYRKAKREEQAHQTIARGEAGEWVLPESFSPETRKEEIRKNLLRLDSKDREILVLFFQENRSCQEISEMLRLDPHNVSVRKWRALKKIRLWMR